MELCISLTEAKQKCMSLFGERISANNIVLKTDNSQSKFFLVTHLNFPQGIYIPNYAFNPIGK